MKTGVSTVVIGRNEGPRLGVCLDSVGAMDRQGFAVEVVYVDSNSVDGSAELAEACDAQVISLALDRPTAAAGRNAGWHISRGEIVLFLDGDTILHPSFVKDSLAAFDDPSVAIVWGHRRETLATPSLYNRVLDLDWVYPVGDSAFCGGDALFRREVLERTGGFDETLIAGEEPELCSRITALGYRILHVDRPMTGHDLAVTRFRQYLLRATRAGHAFAEVSSRRTTMGHTFWLVESRNNSRRALFLMAVPLFCLGVAVIVKSVLPLLLLAACFTVLVARTAWKARWKSQDRTHLLLYGVHSHLQQIPIFAGQMRFWLNQRAGRQERLVEYK